MNPNQVRHHEDNIHPAFSQLKTGLEQNGIEVRLPGVAGVVSWSPQELARYIHSALAIHGNALIADVLPHLPEDHVCIALAESIALARAYTAREEGQSGEDIPASALPGLASRAQVPLFESLVKASYALNFAAPIILERICNTQPVNLHRNLLLAECFCIAIAVIEFEQGEVLRSWKDDLYAFAERTMAACLRSPDSGSPTPQHEEDASPREIPVISWQNA